MTEQKIPEVEAIMPGLELHWYFERKVVKYVVSAINPSILNDWSQVVISLIENWPEGKPYLALHDLSDRGVGMSYAVQVKFDMLNLAVRPEAHTQVEKLLRERKISQTRVALLFNSFHSGYVGQMFARRSYNTLPDVSYEVFYDDDGALDWLAEVITTTPEENDN